MSEIVEVSFKGNRRAYYAAQNGDLELNEYVIVEADRGEDLGRITAAGAVAERKCSGCSTGCAAPVLQYGLKMKVSEAEWQFDRNKLTIYFTAERRVDFRELVRDLAKTFRTRIELKQIGVRDESALLGGVGRCGAMKADAMEHAAARPGTPAR